MPSRKLRRLGMGFSVIAMVVGAASARVLRIRVRYSAGSVSCRLTGMYPVALDPNPQCYRSAVPHVMAQADTAIYAARGYY